MDEFAEHTHHRAHAVSAFLCRADAAFLCSFLFVAKYCFLPFVCAAVIRAQRGRCSPRLPLFQASPLFDRQADVQTESTSLLLSLHTQACTMRHSCPSPSSHRHVGRQPRIKISPLPCLSRPSHPFLAWHREVARASSPVCPPPS